MKIGKVLVFLSLFFMFSLNGLAKNEYLQSILIDNLTLEGFETDKYTYDLDYESEKSEIKIAYTYDLEKYKVKTTGSLTTLDYGMNVVTITLTNKEDSEDSVTYTLNIKREASSENALSSLTVANQSIELKDKDTFDVYVDSKLDSVLVKATLKDQKAKFVEGYGERLENNKVKLSGETTKVEIKVEAQDKSVKTYTINIIKKDYKSNDATLKSLKIDKIDYTFKSNIVEYNLSVSYEINKIKLTPVATDDKAKIDYTEEISLKEGVNNIVVTVTAEDGTKKEYKYNVTRNKEVPLVSSVKIKDLDFNFDYNTYEYIIETELDKLEFEVTLSSEDITYEILNNENLENNSIITLKVKKGDALKTYNFKIKKEIVEDEEIKDEMETNKQDTTVKEDKPKEKSEFLEKYEMHIGLGSFGLGLFSLLIAILTKPKKSQIM